MQTCLTCYSEKPLILLHDNCQFCSHCITTWIETQIIQNLQQFTLSITCLTENCGKSIKVEEYFSHLTSDEIERINSALYARYLTRTPDILFCSQNGCKYAGFTTNDQFGCKTPFICESCHAKWEHPLVVGTSDSIRMKFMNFIVTEFMSKKCPKCSVPIMKKGGCDHMTCTSCNHEYSWRKTHYRGWKFVGNVSTIIVAGLSIVYSKSIYAFGKRTAQKLRQPEFYSARAKTAGGWILDILTADAWITWQIIYHVLVHKVMEKRKPAVRRFAPIFHFPPIALIFWLARKYPARVKRVLLRGFLVPVGLMLVSMASFIGAMILSDAKRRRERRRRDE